MFDLQVLAYQTDLTRVINFMLGREISGRTYGEIGVPDSHHPTSHHGDDPALYEKITKINEFHVSLLGYYLDKLQATPDGDGSLFDHMVLLYGAGMSGSEPDHSARGCGRNWNFTRLPGSTGPPSTCHAASAPYVA